MSLFRFWKSSAAMQAAAEREMLEARDVCRKIFGGNLSALLQDRDGLSGLILAPGYDYKGFNDLFLRGVLAAFMDGRPALPTEQTSRALLHMAAYLVEQEKVSLSDGIDRAKVAEQRCNDNQPIFNAFLEAGKLAYRDNDDNQLRKTSRRIRTSDVHAAGVSFCTFCQQEVYLPCKDNEKAERCRLVGSAAMDYECAEAACQVLFAQWWEFDTQTRKTWRCNMTFALSAARKVEAKGYQNVTASLVGAIEGADSA